MLNKKSSLTGIAFCALFLLEACAPSLPMLKKDSMPLPPSFPQVSEGKLTEDGQRPQERASDTVWREFFQDPALITMIDTALKSNQELQILDQQIMIANNEIMFRQGEYLPKFSAQVGGGVEKIERFSTPDANQPVKFGRAGISSTWEIDIWKKLRNATKAAYYDYLASIEGRRFAVTTLVSEVANTYYELMAYDNQLQIVNDYIDILQKIRGFVLLQQQAGRVTMLPVKRFEAEVLKNQGRKYQLEQQVVVTQNKLNALLGRFPQKIGRDSRKFTALSLSKINSSVPTKLLENRPDVKQAGLELEAAKLNVDVARARFYPSLNIEGAAGYENFNSKHFENPMTTSFYAIAGGLSAPLLNRKAIKADYFSANNKQIQAIYHYEQTLIKAYGDVVNQLNMIKNYNSIFDMKSKQVQALNDSIEISNTLFKAGRVDYVESLLTQRDSLEAQIDLVEVKKQQLGAYVNLYRSLGGGWRGIKEDYQSNY